MGDVPNCVLCETEDWKRAYLKMIYKNDNRDFIDQVMISLSLL